MTKSRKKFDATFKAKVALEALQRNRRFRSWPSAMVCIRTRFIRGRSRCWTMSRVFSRGASGASVDGEEERGAEGRRASSTPRLAN